MRSSNFCKDVICAVVPNLTVFVKGALKIVCLFNNNVSVSGGFRPPFPLLGLCRRPRWENSVPKLPLLHCHYVQ